MTFSLFWFDGTGDEGDSVMHFLFARYAPSHTELFFDHWAKPFFVLLACPFAQFGFIGIKVFNLLVSTLTFILIFKLAKAIDTDLAWVAPLFFFFSPLQYILSLSGLTEPLFSLFLVWALYLFYKEKYIISSIIVSFLPMIRTEGLLLLPVFFVFLLIKQEKKALAFLFIGQLLYSFAGYFVYHDFFWVFSRIPYAKIDGAYGSGELMSFVFHLIYVVGIPLYILFWIGFVKIPSDFIRKNESPLFLFLIWTLFGVYFIAHSLFWYLGIFNSMGLKRVLIGIMPLLVIISFIGFKTIIRSFSEKKTLVLKVLQTGIIIYIIIFPFTSNPAAVDFKKDMKLIDSQRESLKLSKHLHKEKMTNNKFLYSYPYLSIALNIDKFDTKKHLELFEYKEGMVKSGEILILHFKDVPLLIQVEKDTGLKQICVEENYKYFKVYSKK